jgi:hypothetical protein
MTVTDYMILRKMHRPVHNGDDFSRIHPKMRRGNRAKIFAPFDALSYRFRGERAMCTEF